MLLNHRPGKWFNGVRANSGRSYHSRSATQHAFVNTSSSSSSFFWWSWRDFFCVPLSSRWVLFYTRVTATPFKRGQPALACHLFFGAQPANTTPRRTPAPGQQQPKKIPSSLYMRHQVAPRRNERGSFEYTMRAHTFECRAG